MPSHFLFRKPKLSSLSFSYHETASPLSEVSVTMSDGSKSQLPFPLKKATLLPDSKESYMCIVKEVQFPGKVCDVDRDISNVLIQCCLLGSYC